MYVDEYTCIGCTNCAHVAPNTFYMDDEHGRARVFQQCASCAGVVSMRGSGLNAGPLFLLYIAPHPTTVAANREGPPDGDPDCHRDVPRGLHPLHPL